MVVLEIGVLDLQGAVSEHVEVTKKAVARLKLDTGIHMVKYPGQVQGLTHLIIGGGESTVMSKLMQRNGMDTAIVKGAKKGLKIFGTCAGMVLLAKNVHGLVEGQKTLGLMDIRVRRNAFGRQAESFEKEIRTEVGDINAVFIRAPKIESIGEGVKVLAMLENDIVAVQQGNQFLAASFHPELGGSTVFHEHFLKM